MSDRQCDHERRPFWTVFTIFDPDGEGSDFAYTAGLAERGHPELHMWSRPSLGNDPGEDWKFSMRDSCQTAQGFGDSWGQEACAGVLEWMQCEAAERSHLLRNLRSLLTEGLHSFLSTVAVDDTLDPPTRALGVGPVLCALAGPGRAPGPEWLAADQVLDVLRGLVAAMSVDGLVAASLGWNRARHADESSASLQMRVDARSVTSATFAPLPQEWMSFSTALMVKQRLHPEPLALAQDWGQVVTTVLTHCGSFSAEQVDAFVQASGNPTGLAHALKADRRLAKRLASKSEAP